MPLLVNVPPLAFIVMLLFDATVTPLLIVTPRLLVVVTGPPLKLIVVAPLGEPKMSACPALVGAMSKEPPVVLSVALPLLPGPLMVSDPLAPSRTVMALTPDI